MISKKINRQTKYYKMLDNRRKQLQNNIHTVIEHELTNEQLVETINFANNILKEKTECVISYSLTNEKLQLLADWTSEEPKELDEDDDLPF